MAAHSSVVKWRFCSMPTASSSYAVLLAPISTEVTFSSRNTQASAICDSFCPRASACLLS